MSAGYSSASGKESTQQNQTSQTTGERLFDSMTTQSVAVPKWAKKQNRAMSGMRAEDEGTARDFLTALLSDPYSGGGNRFSDAISHSFDTQLARARTGDTSKTGVAKQGFREAGALAQAQRDSIAQGLSSAVSLLTGPNADTNIAAARSFAPTSSRTVGSENTVQNMVGQMNAQGTSSGSNWGAGINLCCFIFLEAYTGRKMPWWVRNCRDQFCSGPRVLGYRRMARWCVPLMRVSSTVRRLVERFLVNPLTAWGGWLYGVEGYRHGWLWWPFVAFWFSFWERTAPQQEDKASN